MSKLSRVCPHCRTELPPNAAARLPCPNCQQAIAPLKRRPALAPGKGKYPTAKLFAPPQRLRSPAARPKQLWPIVAAGGGLALVLAVLIGWVVFGVMRNAETVVLGDAPPQKIGDDELPSGQQTGVKKPTSPKETPLDTGNPRENPPKTEPPKAEPPKVEPPKTEPPKVEPPKTEPPKTEPPKTLPLPTEPPKTDPPKTEPPKTEPPATTPPLKPGQAPVVLLPLEPLQPFDSPALIPAIPKSDLKHNVVTFTVGEKNKRLRLAVTPQGWDNLGALLTKLGPGYNYTNITAFDLVDINKLMQFDVIFINCAGNPLQIDNRVYANLRAYVQKGGIIYASDLRYNDLAVIFKDYIANRNGVTDLQGDVSASVIDEGLKRILGPKVNLHFDFMHCPAAFDPAKAKIYLMTYQKNFLTGKVVGVPLLTKFAHGKGQVVYTSFHNSTQLSDVETKLLWSIIFATVNAHAEVKAWQTLLEKGYSAKEMKNLALSQGYSLARQAFAHDGKGKLALSLGFRNENAKFRLKVITPDGKVIEHTDTTGFLLEIEDAPEGTWQYSVTAIEAPYDNFPFSLMVAQSKVAK